MTRLGTIALAALAAITAAAPSQAKWMQATSRHFVVYADATEEDMRRQATELERFDAMLRRFQKTGPDDLAEMNRVTVFVVPDVRAVQKLTTADNAYGFYVPRVEGSIAITPRTSDTGVVALTPRIVLFHEYAHHFLFGNSAFVYPAWFVEGYAEFCSTVMERDGGLWLGAAANHRAGSLFNRGWNPHIRDLFAPVQAGKQKDWEATYAYGWLLTHYLMLDGKRRAQLGRYLALFNAGKPSMEAATEAFGDLNALDKAVKAYLNLRQTPAMRVELKDLPTPAVEVRALSAGESALIDYRIQSTRGVNEKTAGPLYARAKVVAVPFGKDAVAQGWLAEMASDAQDWDAASAAADAALAIDATSWQALRYRATVDLMRLWKAKSTDAKQWTAARGAIIAANRARPDDPGPLLMFYESFGMEGRPPSKGAIAGLYRATEIAPQDKRVRFIAARQLVLDGDTDSARQLLRMLASDPHADGDVATRLLALLDSGQSGKAAIDALEKAAQDAKQDAKTTKAG